MWINQIINSNMYYFCLTKPDCLWYRLHYCINTWKSVPSPHKKRRYKHIKSVSFASLHIEIWKISNCGKRSEVDAHVYGVGFTFIAATRYSRTSICDNKVLSHVFYMPVQNHQPKGHGIYFHSANETDYFHSMHIFPDEFLRNHFLWI